MENFPELDIMKSLIDDLKKSIKQDDSQKIIQILENNVEGYGALNEIK